MATSVKEPLENTCLMLPVKLRNRARKLANDEDRSLSALVRHLLRNYVAESERRLSA